MTPGKVVGRSDVAEILQFEPTTEKVLKRPLLICPPWINKFYILDLNPQKSFIRWALEQGHTVFVISWVNPDERHGMKGWEAYIREGLQYALDTVQTATGEDKVNAIGYCVGGTLLAAALALAGAGGRRPRCVRSRSSPPKSTSPMPATSRSSSTRTRSRRSNAPMGEKGYLDGTKMATAFNMLRSGDLIWPYVVNNYMRGKDPLPFDLLYWNCRFDADGGGEPLLLPAQLLSGEQSDQGAAWKSPAGRLSLGDVTIPVYNLSAREDHIAPARSVFLGCHYFGGPVEFVMAGSGHIAGVVNPPAQNKYQHLDRRSAGRRFR